VPGLLTLPPLLGLGLLPPLLGLGLLPPGLGPGLPTMMGPFPQFEIYRPGCVVAAQLTQVPLYVPLQFVLYDPGGQEGHGCAVPGLNPEQLTL